MTGNVDDHDLIAREICFGRVHVAECVSPSGELHLWLMGGSGRTPDRAAHPRPRDDGGTAAMDAGGGGPGHRDGPLVRGTHQDDGQALPEPRRALPLARPPTGDDPVTARCPSCLAPRVRRHSLLVHARAHDRATTTGLALVALVTSLTLRRKDQKP
jgi:hypothetical protein